jgi:hypothetical protein
MSDLSVANTILEQMGGKRIGLFIGATQFIGDENSLTIKWKAKSKNKANCVRITLTPMDVYIVTFLRISGSNVFEVSKHEEVYCDSLKELFETETGLYLSF